MARRKNVKRIDPRYFLDETANRNDDGSALEEEKLEEFKGIPAHREKQRALKGMSADPKAQCRELQAKISQLEGDLTDSMRDPHGQAGQYISQHLHAAQEAAKKAGCGLAENLEESEELEEVEEVPGV